MPKYEKPELCGTPSFLDPRKGPSPIGPGPVVPKGSPPPSSKGSISYPKPAVGGK